MPDYNTAKTCLQQNLALMTGPLGNVKPENQILWNLSNALLVICDALQRIDQRTKAL